jgi:hypothetical protein
VMGGNEEGHGAAIGRPAARMTSVCRKCCSLKNGTHGGARGSTARPRSPHEHCANRVSRPLRGR